MIFIIVYEAISFWFCQLMPEQIIKPIPAVRAAAAGQRSNKRNKVKNQFSNP